MLHTTSIKLNKEFRRAYYRGKSFTTPLVTIYAFRTRRLDSRLGLTASKKIGKAVQRNRARRVMKEAYRLLEDRFPKGYDYVLVARTKTIETTTPQMVQSMRFALSRLFAAK